MTRADDAADAAAPAFEWCAAERRIIWANAAGVAFWNAPSLAALRARPFAAGEYSAKALMRQSELLNHSTVSEGWLALSPDMDVVHCQVRRAPGRTDESVLLEVLDISDPAGKEHLRAAAAFEEAPAAQVVVDLDGRIMLRNDADRDAFAPEASFPDRFQEPAEARRALRAATEGDGYAHLASVRAKQGFRRRQIVYRRIRDPLEGRQAVLGSFGDAPTDETGAGSDPGGAAGSGGLLGRAGHSRSTSTEFYSPMPDGYRPGFHKYVFVVGTVMSGLGKGIFASSLAKMLKDKGLTVAPIKMQGYLNLDSGTLNPYRQPVQVWSMARTASLPTVSHQDLRLRK